MVEPVQLPLVAVYVCLEDTLKQEGSGCAEVACWSLEVVEMNWSGLHVRARNGVNIVC